MASEIEQMKEKLTHQESQVQKTKMELHQKEEQLKHLHDEIAQNKKKIPEDPLAVIREELARLGIDGNSGKLADALSALSSITSKDKSRI